MSKNFMKEKERILKNWESVNSYPCFIESADQMSDVIQ